MVEYDSENNSLFESTGMMDFPSKKITQMIDLGRVGYLEFFTGEDFIVHINRGRDLIYANKCMISIYDRDCKRSIIQQLGFDE